jgi:hypothetical protein
MVPVRVQVEGRPALPCVQGMSGFGTNLAPFSGQNSASRPHPDRSTILVLLAEPPARSPSSPWTVCMSAGGNDTPAFLEDFR